MPTGHTAPGRPSRADIGADADPMALVFRALADTTRRDILDRLRDAPGQTLAALVEASGLRRQTVSQHLKILAEANLVTVLREGRESRHYLNPVPIREIAGRWIDEIAGKRADALAALKQSAEEKTHDN